MNEETIKTIGLIKEYIDFRINIEIKRGLEERRGKKGELTLNDKVSRWKQRLERINQQLCYFCDNPHAVDR